MCVSQAHGQSRSDTIDVLNNYCRVSSEVWAASGYSNSEVTQVLDAIHSSGAVTVILDSQASLTDLQSRHAACLQQLRSPTGFEDESEIPSEEQLEAQLNELANEIQTTKLTLQTAADSLRLNALSSRLGSTLLEQVAGTSRTWGSLPVHWRFANIEDDFLPTVVKVYQSATRHISAEEPLSAEMDDVVSSIESQYPVSLAFTRIQSNLDSIVISIEQWASASP
jgi:hypothetical protein